MVLWSLKGRTILVVDDFPGMRSMLRSMLAMYGAETVGGRLTLFVEGDGPGCPESMQVNSAPDLGRAIDFESGSNGLGLYFSATMPACTATRARGLHRAGQYRHRRGRKFTL